MAGLLETLFPYLDNAKTQAIANVKAAIEQGMGNKEAGIAPDPLGALKGVGQGVAHGVAAGTDALGGMAQQVFTPGMPSQGSPLADAVDKVSGYNPANPDAAGSGGVGEMLSNLVNPPVEKGAALAGILLGPMSRGVDTNMMAKALDMIQNRVPLQKVFKETGWAPSASGRTATDLAMATELPTQGIGLRKDALHHSATTGQDLPLEDMLTGANDLFTAQPELKNSRVQANYSNDAFNSGSTDPGRGTITIDRGLLPAPQQPDSIRSVMMHEIQHNVDYHNMRLFGANPIGIGSHKAVQVPEQALAQHLMDSPLLSGYPAQEAKDTAAGTQPGFLAYLLNGGEVNARNAALRDKVPKLQDLHFGASQDVDPSAVLHFGSSKDARQAIMEALLRMPLPATFP